MFIGDTFPVCNLCKKLDPEEKTCLEGIETKTRYQSMLIFILREDEKNCNLYDEELEEKKRKERVNKLIDYKRKDEKEEKRCL